MSLHLSPPLRVGALRLWVVSDCRASGHALAGGVVFAASKRPVAIALDDGATVRAFAPDGRPLSPEAWQALCPEFANCLAEARAQDRG